ncbi:hypothetical protein GINT2_001184 [Glugoides intestinalis]
MEQDLVLLGLNIKKDPQTYQEEFLEQLKILESLLKLPAPPLVQIKPMIFFIVRYSIVDPQRSIRLLIDSLDRIHEYRTRKVVLSGLIIMRQKKYIESKELLRLIIMYGNDLRYFLTGAQEFLDLECYAVLCEWYGKGTERQKSFCYYLLLVLFSKIHAMADRKRGKESRMYNMRMTIDDQEFDSIDEEINNCDELDESGEDESDEDTNSDETVEKRIPLSKLIKDEVRFNNERKIVDLSELESLICDALFLKGKLAKTCILYFLDRTEMKFDITKLKKGKEYAVKVFKELSNETMDRDIKLMKLRIFVQLKHAFAVEKTVLPIVMDMLDIEREDMKDILECLVESVDESDAHKAIESIGQNFVDEKQSDEVVVLGLNVLREIYARMAKDGANEEKLEKYKEQILKAIVSFKGNRTKSIFYAYKMVVKVVVENEEAERGVEHIKKKMNKEEKTEKRNACKAEVKRLRDEVKRDLKQKNYKKKTKGRKKTAMLKYMLRPNKKK